MILQGGVIIRIWARDKKGRGVSSQVHSRGGYNFSEGGAGYPLVHLCLLPCRVAEICLPQKLQTFHYPLVFYLMLFCCHKTVASKNVCLSCRWLGKNTHFCGPLILTLVFYLICLPKDISRCLERRLFPLTFKS